MLFAVQTTSRQTVMFTVKLPNLETKPRRKSPSALATSARRTFLSSIERGAGGARAHRRFADGVDGVIREIVREARAQTTTPVAVVALGGYGRRALCLHSDLDLLIVFDGTIGEKEERFVKAVLLPLWDLRFTVGHQVRILSDFDEFERDNPEFLLALVLARAGHSGKVYQASIRWT